MKIAIVSSTVPHINGGYRKFVDLLAPRLLEAGYQVEKVWLPFSSDPSRMLSEMAAFRMADYDAFDLVICTRPPAHVIRHRRKVIWFIHHERIFYDLWDTTYNGLGTGAGANALRQAVIRADDRGLGEARAVYSNSACVAKRLRTFNGIEAEVLYPPLGDDPQVPSATYGDELLFNCRIEHHKRQHLAIEAMAATATPVRLRIVGRASSEEYLAALRELVIRYGLEDRVSIDHRWISEGEKNYLLSHALSCVYIPADEDSVGYPTMEAARAERATVSTLDAGGVGEFIIDGENGLLCEPGAAELGSAFDKLWRDRALARSLGKAARARSGEMGISWERVVQRLTT